MATADSSEHRQRESFRPASAYRRGPRDTVMHALARAVRDHGAREFINIDGDRVTFREIDRRANALARALAGLGFKKGDAVVSIFDTTARVAWPTNSSS